MWIKWRRQILRSLPLILAITGIVLLIILALDASMDYEEHQLITSSLLVHLVLPSILSTMTVIAWRWSLLGGVLFILFGIFTFLVTTDTYMMFISFPPMLIGLLLVWETSLDGMYGEVPLNSTYIILHSPS